MLYYNTISPELRGIVETICTANYFRNFRLCGGSGLALQKGHRVSLDADFVTDRAIDHHELTGQLHRCFNSITDLHTGDHGVFCKVNAIKVDFLSWNIPFIRPAVVDGNFVLADTEEIIAMKLFAIMQRGEKKDYMDVASLLHEYTLKRMISFYKERHKGSDDLTVLRFLTSYSDIEMQPKPEMLNGYTWESCKQLLIEAVNSYVSS